MWFHIHETLIPIKYYFSKKKNVSKQEIEKHQAAEIPFFSWLLIGIFF